MRLAIWTLLPIIPLCYSNSIGEKEEECGQQAQNISYIYDDEILKVVVKDLQETTIKLQEANVKLGEKINILSSKTDTLPDAPIRLPANCAEALTQSGQQSGIHRIEIPKTDVGPFYAYCLADPEGGAQRSWTLVQRRMDGSIDFWTGWKDYQLGFGNLNGEFFLGLDKIHALTQSTLHELWIQMEDFDMVWRHAKYSAFAIGDANQSYALNILGNFSGNAGDSLTVHQGMKFTTKDKDNDKNVKDNCAIIHTGAWWYNTCHYSNLNGQYLKGSYGNDKYGDGIDWNSWHGHTYSLKSVHMAIRPVQSQ